MKKEQITLLLCGICCIGCLIAVAGGLFAMTRINSLEEEILLLRQDLQTMSAALEEKPEEQPVVSLPEEKDPLPVPVPGNVTLLNASSHRYGNVDYRSGTVELYVTLSPRELAPKETKATLLVNGAEQSMELKGSDFIAKLDLPLFEDSRIDSVILSTNGKKQSERLNWSFEPDEQFLLQLYSDFDGDKWISPQDTSTCAWNMRGNLTVQVDQKGGLSSEIEDISLVHLVDGEEVERRSLLAPLKEDGVVIFGDKDRVSITKDDPYTLVCEMDRSFSAPKGTTLELCLELLDSNGLLYREWLDSMDIDHSGKLNLKVPARSPQLFDGDGNLLWEK